MGQRSISLPFFTLFAKNRRKCSAFSSIKTLFAKIILSFILKKIICELPPPPPSLPMSTVTPPISPQLGKNISPVGKDFTHYL